MSGGGPLLAKEKPVRVTRAVMLLCASLVASAILIFLSLTPKEISYFGIVLIPVCGLAAGVIFYVSRGRNWARIFVLIGTVLVVLWAIGYLNPLEGEPPRRWWSTVLAGAMVVFNVAAVYLLFTGSGALWYSQTPEEEDEASFFDTGTRTSEPGTPTEGTTVTARPRDEAKAAGAREYHMVIGVAIGTVLGFALGFGHGDGQSQRGMKGLFMVPFLAAIIGSMGQAGWRLAVFRARRLGAVDARAFSIVPVALWLVPWVAAALVYAFSVKMSSPYVMVAWGILHLVWSTPTVYGDSWRDPLLLSGLLLIACPAFL